MSGRAASAPQPAGGRSAWAGAAFIVEAMLLLVFVAASMAVLVQLYVGAAQRAAEGEDLSRAVAAAGTVAERFASDPAATAGSSEVDGMLVNCDVDAEQSGRGVMYRAVIGVYPPGGGDGGEPLYTVKTSRYVGEVVR